MSTTDPTARFGALRSLLHQPPSRAGLAQLEDLAASLRVEEPARFDEVHRPYLRAHLPRWFAALPFNLRWGAREAAPRYDTENLLITSAEELAAQPGALEVCRACVLSVDALRRHHGALPDAPHLRGLALQQSHGPVPPSLLSWPALRGLEYLNVSSFYASATFHGPLLHAPGLAASLRALAISPEDQAEALPARLPALEFLELDVRWMGEGGLARTLDRVTPGRLRGLAINPEEIPIDPEEIAATLHAHPAVRGLEALHLLGLPELTATSRRVLATLLRSDALRTVRALDLSCGLAGEDLPALCAQSALPGLRWLDVGYNSLSAGGVRALLDWTQADQLEALVLDFNNETCGSTNLMEDLVLWLESRPRHTLSLAGCGVNDHDLPMLARSPGLASLHHLDLHDNPIGEAGAQALLDSPHLRPHTQLELSTQHLPVALERASQQREAERTRHVRSS